MTATSLSDSVSDMKVTSRDFQRDFTRMKAAARAGEAVFITSGDEEFVFQAVRKRSWQGALKGKGRIVGDLFGTGLDWEATE